jgi:Leucine-rich repeat (LRR) protein
VYALTAMYSALPLECAQWTNIANLNLKNNKIGDLLGPIMQSWIQLERLYLGSNLLRRIPMEIGLLLNAVEFDFSGNFIESLPISLSLCTNLELLHLGQLSCTRFRMIYLEFCRQQ